MAQCAATATTTGRRCRLQAEDGSQLCTVHRDLELGDPDPTTSSDPPADPPEPDPPGEDDGLSWGPVAAAAVLAGILVKILRGG